LQPASHQPPSQPTHAPSRLNPPATATTPTTQQQEFDPEDLTRLVVAVADMHVGDAELGKRAAAAVAARRGEYSGEQIAAVRDALDRMGCAGALAE